MFSFLCIFFKHKWKRIFNVLNYNDFKGMSTPFGIYQCSRCKTISKGKYNAN